MKGGGDLKRLPTAAARVSGERSASKDTGVYDGEEKLNMTSLDMNLILDSEGQVEDYFNAERNPF